MDFSLFKLDIDELIMEFEKGNFKLPSDMKRVWMARKFSYIFDAKPGDSNVPCFMQSLFALSVGHMVAKYSLSHRLGGLYCLYFLYMVQPFKPPFKIYLSLGEVRILKAVVIDANKEGISIVSPLVRRMLKMNAFLFGLVNMDDHSAAKTLKINKHKAMLQKMHEKLFENLGIDEFLLMDMGEELDLSALEKISAEYAEAKALAINEAGDLIDVKDIKHIAEKGPTIADEIGKIVDDWNLQKDAYCQQTESSQRGNLLKGSENTEQISPLLQQLAEKSQVEDDSLPQNGFMKLLIAGDEEEEGSREIEVDEIERLLDSGDSQEEDSTYADDLEKQLSEI